MVTISINDNRILSKHNRKDIESKMRIFFKKEFGIDDELVLYGVDLDTVSDSIKKDYIKTKALKKSDFIDY